MSAKSYPYSLSNIPGSWKYLQTAEEPKASFVCPDCEERKYLLDHSVNSDGAVSPSVICDCDFHEWIVLEGWNPDGNAL